MPLLKHFLPKPQRAQSQAEEDAYCPHPYLRLCAPADSLMPLETTTVTPSMWGGLPPFPLGPHLFSEAFEPRLGLESLR